MSKQELATSTTSTSTSTSTKAQTLAAAAPTQVSPVSSHPANWYDPFPTPLSIPEQISVQDLATLLLDDQAESELKSPVIPAGPGTTTNKFLIVDVRRNDFEESFIKGAINLPAHSFYQTLPSLLPILSQYQLVIFHCQSSSGRGPRCAGWYQDFLHQLSIPLNRSKALVLKGGIKQWRMEYGNQIELNVKM